MNPSEIIVYQNLEEETVWLRSRWLNCLTRAEAL